MDEVFGSVVAGGFFVVTADNGKGVEDIANLFLVKVVKVEVESVELAAQVEAAFVVPDERITVAAEVCGKRPHVFGGIGKLEYTLANPGTNVATLEWFFVGFGWENGKLFDDEVIQRLSMDFLASGKIKNES